MSTTLMKLERANARIRSMQEEGKKAAKRLRRMAEIGLGGAAHGLLDTYIPTVPVPFLGDIDSTKLASGVLGLMAAGDVFDDDDVTEFLINLAGGMVAVELSLATSNTLRPQAGRAAPSGR